MKHTDKPEKVDKVPEDVLEFVNKIMNKDTSKNKIIESVRGKKVVDSISGTSGYILILEDDVYLLSFMKNQELELMKKSGEPSQEDILLINSQQYGNGKNPLTVNLPYADEINKMENEIRKCHGKKITGIAIGAADFSICFPNKLELEAIIIAQDGECLLRVFWEQW
ncbi:MAG: hypothetical protein GY754_26385 [bacterium]|nr:hypothetical protein [bacterium]